ncbi:substrate-binding domain-containing protein, partial [Lachnotalea glycerini]
GCKEAGIRFPDDLSLVSFDNIALASSYDVQLTTINQHSEEMSCEAARLILKQLNDSESRPERIILKPSLIIRKTTGPYMDKLNIK